MNTLDTVKKEQQYWQRRYMRLSEKIQQAIKQDRMDIVAGLAAQNLEVIHIMKRLRNLVSQLQNPEIQEG